jgi:uncharacterized protein YgbK (DUF1537 family)
MRKIVIIADDLTGALDSAAPFAARGLRTAALVMTDDRVPTAPADAEVVSVSTGTRELSQQEAGARVMAAVERFAAGEAIFFKKIDSRLQGHPAGETSILMRTLGLNKALIAPAIPDLGRRVENGAIIGWGIQDPIDIRGAFGAVALDLWVPDVSTMADLEEVAAQALRNGYLMAGARGLSAALAKLICPDAGTAAKVRTHAPHLFVIGSRDPVTVGQVEYLRRRMPELPVFEAPNGVLGAAAEGAEQDRIFLVRPGFSPEGSRSVAERFSGETIARLGGARTLIASGGETAQKLLHDLGIEVLTVRNELLPGIVCSDLTVPSLGPLTFVTKSGGFGAPATLYDLYRVMHGT